MFLYSDYIRMISVLQMGYNLDRLNEALSGDVVNPMRIVRTEGHRVFSQAQKDRLDEAYKAGTKMTKTWISSKDERVRSAHAEMDGVTVPYEENFVMPDGARGFAPGMIGAPQHDINCRCTWKTDVLDDYEKEGGQSEEEDGILKIKLQLFARKSSSQAIKDKIQAGLLNPDEVRRGLAYFKMQVKNGIQTPIGLVTACDNNYYHIIDGHPEFLRFDEIDKIISTLKEPDSIRIVADRYKKMRDAYFKLIEGKELLVVTEGNIITAYYPSENYLRKLKGGELKWQR